MLCLKNQICQMENVVRIEQIWYERILLLKKPGAHQKKLNLCFCHHWIHSRRVCACIHNIPALFIQRCNRFISTTNNHVQFKFLSTFFDTNYLFALLTPFAFLVGLTLPRSLFQSFENVFVHTLLLLAVRESNTYFYSLFITQFK